MKELLEKLEKEKDYRKLNHLLEELENELKPVLTRQKILLVIFQLIHFPLYFLGIIYILNLFHIHTNFDTICVSFLKFGTNLTGIGIWFLVFAILPVTITGVLASILKHTIKAKATLSSTNTDINDDTTEKDVIDRLEHINKLVSSDSYLGISFILLLVLSAIFMIFGKINFWGIVICIGVGFLEFYFNLFNVAMLVLKVDNVKKLIGKLIHENSMQLNEQNSNSSISPESPQGKSENEQKFKADVTEQENQTDISKELLAAVYSDPDLAYATAKGFCQKACSNEYTEEEQLSYWHEVYDVLSVVERSNKHTANTKFMYAFAMYELSEGLIKTKSECEKAMEYLLSAKNSKDLDESNRSTCSMIFDAIVETLNDFNSSNSAGAKVKLDCIYRNAGICTKHSDSFYVAHCNYIDSLAACPDFKHK